MFRYYLHCNTEGVIFFITGLAFIPLEVKVYELGAQSLEWQLAAGPHYTSEVYVSLMGVSPSPQPHINALFLLRGN